MTIAIGITVGVVLGIGVTYYLINRADKSVTRNEQQKQSEFDNY